MFRYRRMEITCFILYIKGETKKQKAIVIVHGKSNLFINCKFS